jgi:hypothetical protein
MRWTIRPLDASTWAAFAGFAERNSGVYGGCWCIAYHPGVFRTDPAPTVSARKAGSGQAVRMLR